MGFSKQEYWSGLPFPSPGDLPDPGIEHVSLVSAALAGGFFMISATWEAVYFNMLKTQEEKVDSMYQQIGNINRVGSYKKESI